MAQALPELRMTFADRAALERELESNLSHGRAFVIAACALAVLDDCTLVLVHPDSGGTLCLPAQAVMVAPSGAGQGIGIQLRPFNATTITTLREFLASPPPAAPAASVPAPVPAPAQVPVSSPAPAPDSASAQAELSQAPEAHDDASAELSAHDEDSALDGDPDASGEAAEDGDAAEDGASELQRQKPRHERLRNLNATEQVKLARKAELNDRIMLERLYGRGVWEPLLQNPKLTLPEVATIARKGSVPRPLLEAIVENNAWIQSALVRRALLTNPRVSSEAIMKLLRMTPKHELRVICKTTTYSTQVRDIAKKVLEM